MQEFILFKTSLEKSLFSSPAACIKSLDERLRKLVKKYGENGFSDIAKLRELRDALLQIDAASFSRYTKLLQLLRSPEYGWNADNDDRIVIFTERIETMHFVAAQLRKDLHMTDSSVREMYGGLSDEEQQRIVDEFGRVESPIRVLVASDVASEGINLHYLSHRLIHFDIPWSLMVFQQRNGRVDRYGQTKKPDIRYLMIESKNDRIKGDVRIMEILVTKEEQAYKNIGDPALLMGKFNIEEEEQVTAAAIESGLSAEAFDAQIDDSADDFDPFEALMAMEDDEVEQPEVHLDETLYRDIDYLRSAMSYFAKDQRLVAMILNMTKDQLLSAYRIQFPILQQHEKDTYYGKDGGIVYAKNNALTDVGFSRPEFENPNVVTPIRRSDAPWDGIMKHAPAGYVFARTITDDTMPGGPVERTIEYHAPFDRCDREQDYETAWKFFEEKYGGQA